MLDVWTIYRNWCGGRASVVVPPIREYCRGIFFHFCAKWIIMSNPKTRPLTSSHSECAELQVPPWNSTYGSALRHQSIRNKWAPIQYGSCLLAVIVQMRLCLMVQRLLHVQIYPTSKLKWELFFNSKLDSLQFFQAWVKPYLFTAEHDVECGTMRHRLR